MNAQQRRGAMYALCRYFDVWSEDLPKRLTQTALSVEEARALIGSYAGQRRRLTQGPLAELLAAIESVRGTGRRIPFKERRTACRN